VNHHHQLSTHTSNYYFKPLALNTSFQQQPPTTHITMSAIPSWSLEGKVAVVTGSGKYLKKKAA
jgi:hypothetical protein